jgi:RimJ/RimL family protein N-acetyltransferase
LLDGKTVNLRVVEKEDLPLIAEWLNDPVFFNYAPFPQRSRAEFEKQHDNLPSTSKWFVAEKKDGSKIGFLYHELEGSQMEIGYAMLPTERNKGYGTEAITIIVDYLFLTKQIVRIQVTTEPRNKASVRVLEKNGFKREGTIRKMEFVRGQWVDEHLYSILREEWKEPKILAKIQVNKASLWFCGKAIAELKATPKLEGFKSSRVP